MAYAKLNLHTKFAYVKLQYKDIWSQQTSVAIKSIEKLRVY